MRTAEIDLKYRQDTTLMKQKDIHPAERERGIGTSPAYVCVDVRLFPDINIGRLYLSL